MQRCISIKSYLFFRRIHSRHTQNIQQEYFYWLQKKSSLSLIKLPGIIYHYVAFLTFTDLGDAYYVYKIY